MRKKQMSLMDPAEAAVLDHITVRLIEPAEQDLWNESSVAFLHLQQSRLLT
jgi:hypothetical protein